MSAPAARTADEAIASVSEFPERLGPVLIKELRQGLRSGLFVIPFLVLPAVLALVAMWALSVENRSEARTAIDGFFWVAVFVPVVIMTPLRALGSIRSEREAQTLDLLQLTPLTAWRIIFAKWSSLVVQSLLWVLALLPFFVLRYFFGQVNLTEEVLRLTLFVLGGAAITAVAMVVSTLPRLMFWLSIAALAFGAVVSLFGILGALFSRRLFSGMLGSGAGDWQIFLLMDGLLMHATILALALTASRIAPQADNYAARLRLGTLTIFAWSGIAAVALPLTARDGKWFFFVVATVSVTLLAGYELVSDRQTLAVHLQPWKRFGLVGRWLARAFMPGWPSTVVFGSFVAIVATIILATTYPDKAARISVIGALAWCAVVLPRGIQCMVKRNGIERPILHLLLHLCGGMFAAILGAFTFVLGDATMLPAGLFPSSLFWLSLANAPKWHDEIALIGAAVAVWVFLLSAVFVTSSRTYWRTVKAHTAK